ncbi:hypothetical protein HK405_002324 [Cladochytrium tenue]|nr:hypothetical protein HK405_002324 [Cladochytrium tenue]
MITEFFIYGIITLYLSAVIPSEFGPRRQWHFPVTDLVTWIKNKESSASASGKWETSLAGLSNDNAALEMEDDDVRAPFDIVWEGLSIEEHLYFYARLKGVNRHDERTTVEKAMEQVSLTSLRRRLTKTLSGGEKRRLSIAIALVGDPAVVFLDEPTTGLDPEVRRLIWNIIQNAKEGKTIILGTLRCLESPIRLKSIYGRGFRLFFNSRAADSARACSWVESVLSSGLGENWRKIDAFATSSSYEFAASPGAIPGLFEVIEAGRAEHGIMDWGVSQTTVFLRLISEVDADGE